MFNTFYTDADVLLYCDLNSFNISKISDDQELTSYFCKLVRIAADEADSAITRWQCRIALIEVTRYARYSGKTL